MWGRKINSIKHLYFLWATNCNLVNRVRVMLLTNCMKMKFKELTRVLVENNRRIRKVWENSMIFLFQKKSERVFGTPATGILQWLPPTHYLPWWQNHQWSFQKYIDYYLLYPTPTSNYQNRISVFKMLMDDSNTRPRLRTSYLYNETRTLQSVNSVSLRTGSCQSHLGTPVGQPSA